MTPAEEKTWSTVSPILAQTLLRMKISSFEPEEISHILPVPFNGIDRQCPEYRLVNGEPFTINRMLTRWALDHDNLTPTTVILLPPPPNHGNIAHTPLGDFRVYGDGYGRLYVIRMAEGRAIIGASDTLVTYGTAAADEIAQISSGYAIYKPSDKDLFLDVSNYNKSIFLAGIRTGNGDKIHILQNDASSGIIFSIVGQAPWANWVIALFMGYHQPTSTILHCITDYFHDLPKFLAGDADIIPRFVRCVQTAQQEHPMGPTAPAIVIHSSGKDFPVKIDSILNYHLFSQLKPSPFILLFLTSSNQDISTFLIDTSRTPVFFQGQEGDTAEILLGRFPPPEC